MCTYNVSSKWRLASSKGNWTNIVLLTHTEDDARNSNAKCAYGCKTWRQRLRVIPDGYVIATKASLKEEMIGYSDALVDCEPISDEVHEVVQNFLEITVAFINVSVLAFRHKNGAQAYVI
jgi:hypothetical protein